MLRGEEGGGANEKGAAHSRVSARSPQAGARDNTKEGCHTLHPCSHLLSSSLVLDLGPFGLQGQVLQEKRKHHWGGETGKADSSQAPTSQISCLTHTFPRKAVPQTAKETSKNT